MDDFINSGIYQSTPLPPPSSSSDTKNVQSTSSCRSSDPALIEMTSPVLLVSPLVTNSNNNGNSDSNNSNNNNNSNSNNNTNQQIKDVVVVNKTKISVNENCHVKSGAGDHTTSESDKNSHKVTENKFINNSNNNNCTDRVKITPDKVVKNQGMKDTSNGKDRVLGCAHYKRRAMFVTPCCNKFYKCRYCHDENETHHFDRKTLTELICSECDTRQKVQAECENCGVRFGKYTCLICNLFDDEDKDQYHCDGCGICRIGGRANFFHCRVCNMCLPIQLKIDGHRCVENMSRSNCPVCLGDIHTSRIPCHIPDCGHLLHKMCFDQLLASGHYVCPICQTSMIDMTKMWEYLDVQAMIMPVPKTHENHFVNILCNDCHKTSTVKFHFVGLKCFHCGGYNTTQDVKRTRTWAVASGKDNTSTSA